jgi:hypothetical protein
VLLPASPCPAAAAALAPSGPSPSGALPLGGCGSRRSAERRMFPWNSTSLLVMARQAISLRAQGKAQAAGKQPGQCSTP